MNIFKKLFCPAEPVPQPKACDVVVTFHDGTSEHLTIVEQVIDGAYIFFYDNYGTVATLSAAGVKSIIRLSEEEVTK